MAGLDYVSCSPFRVPIARVAAAQAELATSPENHRLMRSLPRRIRAAALISVGALGVHDLRYLIAYHGSAAHELSATGHGYLKGVTPLLVGVLVLALANFAVRLLLGRAEPKLPSAATDVGVHQPPCS